MVHGNSNRTRKEAEKQHVETPVPAPGNGEILLKVEAASINPLDCKIQKGMIRPIFSRKFPFIPVGDVAGEVVEVGPGVTNFKAGDKIISTLGTAGGGLAEYAVAKETSTVQRPSEVSAADGACLGIAACTALHSLTISGGLKLEKNEPRSNVLVTAASGGVGHYAVQLAKLGNIHVTATCGACNIEFVKSLGADEVLDYRTPEGAALKSPSGQKYDVVVHCATGIPCTPNAKKLECLAKLVKEGKLKTVIDSSYPLSKAEEAWAKSIEGHATGKVVVEPLYSSPSYSSSVLCEYLISVFYAVYDF
ncbi:chloroplast envelope quinone oxidoreductase [Tanacetum coccineum]